MGSVNGLAPNRRQTIIWTNGDLIHWRIYASLGGDELRYRAFGRHSVSNECRNNISNGLWLSIILNMLNLVMQYCLTKMSHKISEGITTLPETITLFTPSIDIFCSCIHSIPIFDWCVHTYIEGIDTDPSCDTMTHPSWAFSVTDKIGVFVLTPTEMIW